MYLLRAQSELLFGNGMESCWVNTGWAIEVCSDKKKKSRKDKEQKQIKKKNLELPRHIWDELENHNMGQQNLIEKITRRQIVLD